MKKYLIKIALFSVIIIIVDMAFGKVCDYLRDHTKGGFSGNIHYICEQCEEDIIMMGSSRMKHHYVPQVFEDSLGMSCYNAGIDGNGIITAYGFLEMILERYKPKMIFYDVNGFDLYSDDNTKYLSTLKPYYYCADVPEIFSDVNTLEQMKMMSSLYRYNSSFLGLLGDNYHPLQQFDRGYWPLTTVMDYDPELPDTGIPHEIDSLKLQYVDRFIDLAYKHDVMLVFSVSPTYWGKYMKGEFAPIESICKSEGVPFVDFYFNDVICSSKDYWADATHLNDKGAVCFSKKMCDSLKTVFVNN